MQFRHHKTSRNSRFAEESLVSERPVLRPCVHVWTGPKLQPSMNFVPRPHPFHFPVIELRQVIANISTKNVYSSVEKGSKLESRNQGFSFGDVSLIFEFRFCNWVIGLDGERLLIARDCQVLLPVFGVRIREVVVNAPTIPIPTSGNVTSRFVLLVASLSDSGIGR